MVPTGDLDGLGAPRVSKYVETLVYQLVDVDRAESRTVRSSGGYRPPILVHFHCGVELRFQC